MDQILQDREIIFQAIRKLRPNAGFSCGDSYAELTWLDEGQDKPTEKEFNDAVKAEKELHTSNKYQRDRQYPSWQEQLDMLFHDMTAGKGTKDGEWYKAVAKVKTDNPKPTE